MSDDPVELAVQALLELGFESSQQELTPGMESVLELMQMASEGINATELLAHAKNSYGGRTSPSDTWKISYTMARVLGSSYKQVTIDGRNVPRGYWSNLERELALSGIEMTRQSAKDWVEASPLRWSRILTLATIWE